MAATVRTQRAQRVSQHRREEVVVLRPVGALDGTLVGEVRQLALEAHAPVIVELTECVLVDPAALQRIALGWERYRPQLCIVCHRASGRQLLERAGIDQHLAIFERVGQALVARAESPDGWAPA